MVSGKTIIDRASKLLLDDTAVRWTTTELLDWLNAGQNETVLLKPDSHVTVVEYKLVPGTLQSLPDGSANFKDSGDATVASGIVLLDIVRNMGTDGTVPGKAIHIIDRELLDALNPDWHSVTADAEVIHYMSDNKAPKIFYVYPPQPASSMGYVEVMYSSKPTPVASYAADKYIDLDDIYENILLDYVLYRAFAKDNSDNSNQKAVSYYSQFRNALLGKDQMEELNDPNAPINLKSASFR